MPALKRKTLNQFQQRYTELKTLQQPHLTVLKDLRDYEAPDRGFFEEDDGKRGKRRDAKVFNGVPRLSARTFGAGMNANNTSKARPWFRISLDDLELMKRSDVKIYLRAVQDKIYQIFNKSNFYTSASLMYLEIGVFGTAAMFIEEDFEDVVRFKTLTMGEYFIAENDRGVIDVLYRRIWMTPASIIEKFGKENVSRAVNDQLKTKPDGLIKVIHAVEPNDDRIPDLPSAQNKAYRSVYYEQASNEEKVLRLSGFDFFPYMVPRWSTIGGDPYGTGQPGLVALGDAKQLQTGALKKQKGLDRNLNPPLQAPSGMKTGNIMNVPGGVSHYNEFASNGEGIKPLYEVRIPLRDIIEDQREVETRIRSAYFVDLFLTIAANPRPQDMKAEVAFQIDKERLLMLGPVLTQLDDGWLDPLIDKTIEFAGEAGVFPEPPEDLVGEDLKIEYISALAKAQKATAITNMERLSALVGAWAQFDANVIDKLDFDEGVDQAAELLDVPPSFVRSDEQAEAIRVGKTQQQNNAIALEGSVAASEAAKNLSDTKVGTGNALEQLLGPGAT